MPSERIKTLSWIREKLEKNNLLNSMISKENIDTAIRCYDQPNRFYHNYNHLKYLLDKINGSGSYCRENIEILEIVALYHDSVYDPRRNDNEEQSAEYFWRSLQYAPGTDSHIIHQTILDTAYGKPKVWGRDGSPVNSSLRDKQYKVFQKFEWIDLMQMFYNSLDTLIKNEELIFKEYQFYDYNHYRKGRLDFLTKAFNDQHLEKEHETIFKSYIEYVSNRKPKIGIYAGSFNPFHVGHYNILEQAEKHFDKIIILAAINPSKEKSDGVWIMNELQKTLPYHQVVQWNGLLADYIERFNQDYGFQPTIIRGLRNGYDLEYEINLRKFLKDSGTAFDIVYYVGDSQYQHVSSSAIRDLKSFKTNDADKYLVKKFQ